jgi:hypothetical protein
MISGERTGDSVEQLEASNKAMEAKLSQIGSQREVLVGRNPQLAFSTELEDVHSDWIRFQQLVCVKSY